MIWSSRYTSAVAGPRSASQEESRPHGHDSSLGQYTGGTILTAGVLMQVAFATEEEGTAGQHAPAPPQQHPHTAGQPLPQTQPCQAPGVPLSNPPPQVIHKPSRHPSRRE